MTCFHYCKSEIFAVKNISWFDKTTMHYWNIEILNVEHQVSSASSPQLWNNGSSVQEGQWANIYIWAILACPAIIPDFFAANAYLYFSFVGFLSHTIVSCKVASHTWQYTW